MRICRITGKESKIIITIRNTYYTTDYGMPKRLEEHEFNPRLGQTILDVVGDEYDEFGNWTTAGISCESCGESMSASEVESHFLTKEELVEIDENQEMG